MILRDFRALVEAVQKLAAAPKPPASEEKLDDLHRRVDSIELQKAKWEAEVEAVLLKAEGKLSAANNAEARARTMKKNYEKHFDPLDDDREAAPQGIPPGDGSGFGEQGMLPMPMGVENDYLPETPKSAAIRAKFI
jgi:hypothetical protein